MRTLSFRRIIIKGVALAGAGVFLMALPASPAFAAVTSGPVVVRSIDATNPQQVTLTLAPSLNIDSNTNGQVTENGQLIQDVNAASAGDLNRPTDIVIVMDTSAATAQSSAFAAEKAAALGLVSSMRAGERISVVSAGATIFSTQFTTDVGQLTTAINGANASGDSQLWTAVRTAASLAQSSKADETDIVVLSADTSAQSGKLGSFTLASNEAAMSGAAVFGLVDEQNPSAISQSLAGLAGTTGGLVKTASDPNQYSGFARDIQSALNNEEILTYASSASGAIDLNVTVGNSSQLIHSAIGTRSIGGQVAAVGVAENKETSFLFTPEGRLLLALGVLIATTMIAFGVVDIVTRERSQLGSALRLYPGEYEDENTFKKVSDFQLINRAIAETERVAEKRGLLQIVRVRLSQANLPLRPAEVIFFTGLSAVLAMIVGFATFGILGMAIAGAVFLLLPIGIVERLARRRRNRFEEQLPDMLQLLAGTLRAGYSLLQGLDVLSKQTEDPIKAELTLTLSEARLGRPIEEALKEVAERTHSKDFETVVTAIEIQREVGGNLAELLMQVKKTLVARKALRGEVKALTAEGRISAIVLVSLPPGVGAMIELVNPSYLAPMLSSFLGQAILGMAAVSMAFGWIVMRKLMHVEM